MTELFDALKREHEALLYAPGGDAAHDGLHFCECPTATRARVIWFLCKFWRTVAVQVDDEMRITGQRVGKALAMELLDLEGGCHSRRTFELVEHVARLGQVALRADAEGSEVEHEALLGALRTVAGAISRWAVAITNAADAPAPVQEC